MLLFYLAVIFFLQFVVLHVNDKFISKKHGHVHDTLHNDMIIFEKLGHDTVEM